MPTAAILVVQHEPDCPPAWVGEWLTEAGAALDIRHPYAGQPLPDDLADHAGLVVLGGRMGATDDAQFGWLAPTRALIREAAGHGIPALGICLGHQLAAVALGGSIAVNPAGQQLGLLDIGWLPAAAADPLMPRDAPRAVQWNHDVVTVLPEGSVVLARAATGELQAARFAGTVWGVQWHPEAGAEVVRPWAEGDRAEAAARGVDVDPALADIAAATELLRRSWRPLAARFVGLAGSSLS